MASRSARISASFFSEALSFCAATASCSFSLPFAVLSSYSQQHQLTKVNLTYDMDTNEAWCMMFCLRMNSLLEMSLVGLAGLEANGAHRKSLLQVSDLRPGLGL